MWFSQTDTANLMCKPLAIKHVQMLTLYNFSKDFFGKMSQGGIVLGGGGYFVQ